MSITYGPQACIAAICPRNPPSPQYAPLSSTSVALRATSFPSRVTPVSNSIAMPSRRWAITRNSSSRENTSLTGRLAARAIAATWPSKWRSHLAPKPPPSSGTTMRTSASGTCRVAATPARAAYGTWVEDQIVT